MRGKSFVRTEEIISLGSSFVSCLPHELAVFVQCLKHFSRSPWQNLSLPLHRRQGMSPGKKMSYVVFTASVLTLTAAHASAADTSRSKLFNAHLDLSNTPSAVGSMFKSQARSIVHCATLCLNSACCAGFNFDGSASIPGVCRAYRTGMTSGSSGTSAVNSRTFICQGKEVSGKIRHPCPTP